MQAAERGWITSSAAPYIQGPGRPVLRCCCGIFFLWVQIPGLGVWELRGDQ